MTAYYNENDHFVAEWLRNLILMGVIAPGDVDERSIEDVRPSDLVGYTQCHFFAGIGVWSHALRQAGWPDDRPVWTGSCPCQPFSASGKGTGFADERHLWPSWYWLIQECQPSIILGEQVAAKRAEPWIDLVQADLEAMDYAFGCVPFPSAGIGAPHIRDRAYWVADASSQGLEKRISNGRVQRETLGSSKGETVVGIGDTGGLADAELPSPERHRCHGGTATTTKRLRDGSSDSNESCKVADSSSNGRREERQNNGSAGPTNGFWRDSDWLFCRDGKWRPVEPGTFPLAHGAPERVGRLRAYGNAINAEAAWVWIETVMDFLCVQEQLSVEVT